MKVFIVFLLLALALAKTYPFIDISEKITDADCLTKAYQVIAMRAWQSVGKMDPNWAKNLEILQKYRDHIFLGGYVVPCSHCDPVKQVVEIAAAFKAAKIDTASISVMGDEWDEDKAKNKAFLKAFVTEYKKLGLYFAIITDEANWNRIMGAECNEYSATWLWWVHLDKDPESSKFKKFGGWTQPYAKRYDRAQLCGMHVAKDSEYKA